MARARARGGAPRLYFPSEEETPQIAQFRLLRERLLEESSPRILFVTSAEAGEGKTTVAANLALCLAEFGRSNVLLIDANFSRPGLASCFPDVQGQTCFADQLMQRHRGAQTPFRPVKLPTEAVHLLAVTSGPGTGVSVAWPAFQAVINEFRNVNWINFIVIDGPPTLGSSDAKLVAQRSDRILLTAIAKQTRAKKLSEAAQTLEPKVISGVVLLTNEK